MGKVTKTGAINIRGVSKDLMQSLKSEAALRGLTLRAYVIRILENRSQGLWSVEDIHARLVGDKRGGTL